jgi:hypothetical protein
MDGADLLRQRYDDFAFHNKRKGGEGASEGRGVCAIPAMFCKLTGGGIVVGVG